MPKSVSHQSTHGPSAAAGLSKYFIEISYGAFTLRWGTSMGVEMALPQLKKYETFAM